MRLFTLIVAIFLGTTLTHAQYVPQAPKREYRAVWLTTIKGLDWPQEELVGYAREDEQKAALCAILDSLQAIRINTVLLQTRIRGDVIYPSALEPFAPVFTGKHGVAPKYDPLAFAIEECHRRGMQLHAWLVTIPLGETAYVKGHGLRSLPATKPAQCTRFHGAWYMEPSHSGTAQHLCALVEEIVTRYDVDGIHLDYIRYPEENSNYPDGTRYIRDRRGMSKADWRRNHITQLMGAIYDKVKSLKPWVCVSAATLGKYADTSRYSSYGWNAYHTVHQDAKEWMRTGIVDAIFPMLYYTDKHFYPFVTDWYEGSYGRHVIAGMGTYQLHKNEKNWPLEELTRQLHVVRAHPISGAAQFRSQFVTDNVKGIYDYLRYFYSTPALVPAMPWLSDTLPAMPQGFTTETTSEATILRWQHTEGVKYNIYSSTIFPVDTTDPTNLIESYSNDTIYTEPLPSLVRRNHYAITAIDRYGNESLPLQWENASPKFNMFSRNVE